MPWTAYIDRADFPQRGRPDLRSSDMFEDEQITIERQTVQKIESKFSKRLLFQRSTDSSFPDRLKILLPGDRPSFLFALGNTDLLERPSAGICGSRHASTRAMDIARQTVRLLCESGITIVSGYAAGVDTMAHQTALENGGSTIIVLPEGIAHTAIRRDLRSIWNWEDILILSQFDLNVSWKAWNAMLRNRTIMALSDAMLVVEARSTGGTLDAGLVSLKYDRKVFAVDFSEVDEATAGNRMLLEAGAQPLKKSRQTGKPSITPVLEAIHSQKLSPGLAERE